MRHLLRALAVASALIASSIVSAQTPLPAAPAGKVPPPAAAPAKPADAKPAASAALIDINSAAKPELQALPGIGDARAEAIVKGRPYKGKDELFQKNVIPRGIYDKIKDRIIAKQK